MATVLRRIPQEPAPWKLEVRESWTLHLPLTSLLPHGAFDPNDGPDLVQDWGNSGVCPIVQVIRYVDSPVGPYDTLLFVWPFLSPPSLLLPAPRPKSPRLIRAYASTLSAVQNSRTNWHNPLHLAQFKFTPLRTACFPTDATLIEVSLPGEAKPFFATVASAYGRTFNLPPLPPLAILQPPLRRDERGWLLTERTEIVARSMAVKFYPALDVGAGQTGRRYGDGVAFPNLELTEGEKALKGVVGWDGEVVIGEGRTVESVRLSAKL